MDLPVFVQQFLVHLHDSGRKESTVLMYKHDLQKFFEWLSKYKTGYDGEIWGDLKREDYEAYFTYLKQKKSSDANLKRTASHLNGLISYYRLTDRIGVLQGTSSKQRVLTDNDFISAEDAEMLLKSVISKRNLTENQLDIHPYLGPRNLSMITLMLKYGLTIHEIRSINLQDINFGQDTLDIVTDKNSRRIKLATDDKKIIYQYFKSIPEAVRPKEYTDDPLFIAFHSKKLIYWFDYSVGKPRRLSIRTIKLMIEREVERSGIEQTISGTHLRNSCILSKIKEGWSNNDLISYFGLTSRHALYRYKRYMKHPV
ncbi:tyrosine-type recombinase/integrase [Priestia megaterium]|uniref:tyrosine-type recombinase/integrase n=1 Tax=Priestia megaterium TaxID=1404 RepID=UPI002E24ED92|nr:tyrosine-type recombinase/integrase [Priestia megaterium]MED3933001.1 tyrosine-type recombinase/integrase [Priestia megaterium]